MLLLIKTLKIPDCCYVTKSFYMYFYTLKDSNVKQTDYFSCVLCVYSVVGSSC